MHVTTLQGWINCHNYTAKAVGEMDRIDFGRSSPSSEVNAWGRYAGRYVADYPISSGSDQRRNVWESSGSGESSGSDQRNALINSKSCINSSCFRLLNAQFCTWNEGFMYQAITCQKPIVTICQDAFGTFTIRQAQDPYWRHF